MTFLEFEELLGVTVGHFRHNFIADEVNFGRGQQPLFDVVADKVAESAPEIFMARI